MCVLFRRVKKNIHSIVPHRIICLIAFLICYAFIQSTSFYIKMQKKITLDINPRKQSKFLLNQRRDS